MPAEDKIKQFHDNHPGPDASGINSLYRFHKVDNKNIQFLKELFVNKKLYHALPSKLNDPFECKPDFNWPSSPNKVRDIRKGLIQAARKNGCSKKEAEALISKVMKNPKFTEDTIYAATQNTLSEIRICSFTKAKENLLLWAHYADSHRGFCLEYDATLFPIHLALKVTYNDEYPREEYPLPHPGAGLVPVLTKSKDWQYEEEYRIIYFPEAKLRLSGDGESLFLSDNVIKNIYFGSNIEDSNKEKVLALLADGPFTPGIWQARPSKSSFKLEFEPSA